MVFFKVRSPLAPVSLVHRICTDAAVAVDRKNGSRYIQRLTPISLVARASDEGLTRLAAQVLPPHFHEPDGPSKKVGSLLPALLARSKVSSRRSTLVRHPTLDPEQLEHEARWGDQAGRRRGGAWSSGGPEALRRPHPGRYLQGS